MSWAVRLHAEFETEFERLPESVQDELLALMALHILLMAGDKSGGSAKRFYDQLIVKSDARYARHLAGLGKS